MKLQSPLLQLGALRSVEPLNHPNFWPTTLLGIATTYCLPVSITGLQRLNIVGRLVPGQESLEKLPGIFRNLIAGPGSGGIRCGFEERNSQQDWRGYDSVGVGKVKDVYSFVYTANGSLVDVDAAYAADFLSRLIKLTSLPLRVTPGATGYELQPLRSVGDLKSLGRSPFGVTGFRCRVFEEEAFRIAESVSKTVEILGSGKILACTWNASARGPSTEEEYEVIRCLPLPAKSYQLEFRIRVERVEDLETARSEVSQGVVAVGRIKTGTGGEAFIEVHVSRAGFRLVVDSRQRPDVAGLERRLGVSLQSKA